LKPYIRRNDFICCSRSSPPYYHSGTSTAFKKFNHDFFQSDRRHDYIAGILYHAVCSPLTNNTNTLDPEPRPVVTFSFESPCSNSRKVQPSVKPGRKLVNVLCDSHKCCILHRWLVDGGTYLAFVRGVAVQIRNSRDSGVVVVCVDSGCNRSTGWRICRRCRGRGCSRFDSVSVVKCVLVIGTSQPSESECNKCRTVCHN
jgi:hypothetical protein